MSEFFLSTMNMSISASWIVLAVLLLRLLLKKAPKWITVLLWGIVAIRLICPFSIESVLSLIPSAETISPEILLDRTPEIHSGVPIINSVVNPVIGESFTPDPAASANPLQIWIPILSFVWIAGIAVMLAYTVISCFRVKSKIGTAVLLRDNIFQSENVVSPFVFGLIRPKIYLPFNMNEQNIEHVVAHEQAHIRRKDHWWKPLGFLLLTLHWFNPLVWLGYVLLCRDMELACDEKVVKDLSNQQKADYSQALLTCSVNRRTLAACPLAFGEVGVKKRVKAVLSYKKPTFWIILVALMAIVAVAVCFLTDPISSNAEETFVSLDDYTATVIYNNENPKSAETLVITEKKTDTEIQRIRLPENETFAPKSVYAVDVTFDGNADFLVPSQQSAGAVYFQAYVWNKTEKRFVYAPSFENLPNFSLDSKNKSILSNRTGSMITSYAISCYNESKKDFITKHYLYWEPSGESQMHFVEGKYTEDGSEVLVNEFLVAADTLGIDKDDSKTVQYFKNGSFWDLENAKWNNSVYKPYP